MKFQTETLNQNTQRKSIQIIPNVIYIPHVHSRFLRTKAKKTWKLITNQIQKSSKNHYWPNL